MLILSLQEILGPNIHLNATCTVKDTWTHPCDNSIFQQHLAPTAGQFTCATKVHIWPPKRSYIHAPTCQNSMKEQCYFRQVILNGKYSSWPYSLIFFA